MTPTAGGEHRLCFLPITTAARTLALAILGYCRILCVGLAALEVQERQLVQKAEAGLWMDIGVGGHTTSF